MRRVVPVGPPLSSAPQHPSPRRSIHVKVPELTVEWTGRYSADKTLALFAYAASSTSFRVAAWLLLTPFVALVCPLLLELLPLDDPFAGWHSNRKFLLRTALRTTIISFLIDSQTDVFVPEQRLPRAGLLVMNAVQGALMSVCVILMTTVTGAFPVPFTLITVGPFYGMFAWITRSLFVRLLLPVETDPIRIQRVKRRLRQAIRLVNLRVFMLYVYNLFGAAFIHVGEDYQVIMALVLQLIKLALTWLQWKQSHISDGDNNDDLDASGDCAAAHVASGARFFHTLFTTACLQKSKSVVTMAVIISSSLLQDTLTLHTLHDREQTLARAASAFARAKDTSQLKLPSATALREELLSIAERIRSAPRANQSSVGAPTQALLGHAAPLLTAPEMAFFESATRLLQVQEAVLLRLYVGIFVPSLYIVYVALVQYSPNVQYLPTLHLGDSNDLSSLSRRLAIPAVVKITTFLFLLRRHCHEPGGLRQLAFALSSMHVIVLNSSVWNTLYVFDFALLHNGHDFTFQFKWLRSHD